MVKNPFYSDLHVHTNLSFCAPRETVFSDYVPHCESEGIKILGISNHVYFDGGEYKCPWLDGDIVGHMLKIKNEIAAAGELPFKVLVGAEIEYFTEMGANMTFEQSKNFDYVILAPSHIFNCMYHYEKFDVSTDDKARELIVNNFIGAVNCDFACPSGICHPLYPICYGNEEAVVRGISDSRLADLFALAASKGKSIEIHACLFRDGTQRDEEGLSYVYMNMLKAAKAAGCKFHFGSDAHTADSFIGRHKYLFRAAERLGLDENDLWEVAK